MGVPYNINATASPAKCAWSIGMSFILWHEAAVQADDKRGQKAGRSSELEREVKKKRMQNEPQE